MHNFLYLSALLASQALAVPVEKRAAPNDAALGQGIWVNGQLVRGGHELTATATKSPCVAGDDVLQCATKIAETWNVGTSAAPNSRTLRVPCTINDDQNGHHGACYFDAPISVDYNNCKLSDPLVVSKDTLIFCNDDSCSEQFTFTTSSTQTHTYTYDLKTSVTAGVNFDFFSAQVGVEADWSNAWSDSNTTTSSVQRTWNLNNGESCAATTIQFKVECDATISGITPPPADWTNMIYDSFGNQMGDYWVCNDYRITGPAVDEMCKARQNPTIPVKVDLGTGAEDNTPYTIEGCMFD